MSSPAVDGKQTMKVKSSTKIWEDHIISGMAERGGRFA
jgi:hypothetical protein